MSVCAKILCGNCGYEFLAYSWSDSENPKAFDCPKCFTSMDEEMKQQVFHAMNAVRDINQHFRKYHLERKEPLFVVSVEGIPIHNLLWMKTGKE